jgi:hypothetical protein
MLNMSSSSQPAAVPPNPVSDKKSMSSSLSPPNKVTFGPVGLSSRQEMETEEALVNRIVSSLPDLSFLVGV